MPAEDIPWHFLPFFPLSIRAVKPLLPLVPAHALSTWPRFNEDFSSRARTECTAPGLRGWHRAGCAGLGARHTLGKGDTLSPGYPLLRDAKEQKEELPFASYSDSGRDTKITGVTWIAA